jgi:hypothetical protein
MTARLMKCASVAAVVCAAFFPLSAVPQQPEPATPTLQDTENYLMAHLLEHNLQMQGTSVLHSEPEIDYKFDVMNIDNASSGGPLGYGVDTVVINCKGNTQCIYLSPHNGTIANPFASGVTWYCENAAICPNVINAMNHFIKLVQQQNLPANDPFAPK